MEITSGQPQLNLGGGCSGFGGETAILFLAFLAMMGGFGGFNKGYGGEQPASASQLQNGFNFNDLQDQNRDINSSIANARQSLATDIAGVYSELQKDINNNAMSIANLQAKQQECCCETLRAIDAQNLRSTEQTNSIKNMFMENKIQALRDKVNKLEADARMAGVVRYPNGFVYNAGGNPFCGNSCNSVSLNGAY